MPEQIMRDPELPGRIGGRWRDPVMSPVEMVGARLDGEPRCTEHAVAGATEPMYRLVGRRRLSNKSHEQGKAHKRRELRFADRPVGLYVDRNERRDRSC
jgi:hypothetical protein